MSHSLEGTPARHRICPGLATYARRTTRAAGQETFRSWRAISLAPSSQGPVCAVRFGAVAAVDTVLAPGGVGTEVVTVMVRICPAQPAEAAAVTTATTTAASSRAAAPLGPSR